MRELESPAVAKFNPRIVFGLFVSTTSVSLGETGSLRADSIACFLD